VTTTRVARNFFRTEENNNRLSSFKYFWCSLVLKHYPLHVYVSGVSSWTIVYRFEPTNRSLLSLIQVLNILIVKFQDSTLHQCHHLLINFTCKSACKPLNAQYCTWARSHRGRHYDCAYTVLIRFWCNLHTNTARSTEAEKQLCSEALTSEIGLLQNFRTYEKWILLSSNFWAINSCL